MQKLRRVAVVFALVCSISVPCSAQQNVASVGTTSAQSLLQQSLAAQVGNTQISDITLSGTAHRIASSDDESGTVTLKGLSSGATRLDFNFPSGPRSEYRSPAADNPTGGWFGPDGVVHPIADHNLVNDWSWFPLFSLANAANPQNFLVSLVGTETRNGQSILHVTVSQQFASLSGKTAKLLTHLSQIEIFLDAATLLPASIAYNIHPDDNALLDIPVELQFSDYRPVNGTQIPFHIQKSINNSLAFDLQFQNATLNTGLTPAQLGGAQ